MLAKNRPDRPELFSSKELQEKFAIGDEEVDAVAELEIVRGVAEPPLPPDDLPPVVVRRERPRPEKPAVITKKTYRDGKLDTATMIPLPGFAITSVVFKIESIDPPRYRCAVFTEKRPGRPRKSQALAATGASAAAVTARLADPLTQSTASAEPEQQTAKDEQS
jgi:hypothetical protein